MEVKSISLNVDKKNKAFELYKKLGFQKVKNAGKSVVMRIKLDARK